MYVTSMYHTVTRLKNDYLRVKLMEAVTVLCHFERIASCTHDSPEQVRLPLAFHTPKRCQCTVHDVGLQYQAIVELRVRWSPSSARLCPHIRVGFVWKSQLLLQVLSYPLSGCQFSGQPPRLTVNRSRAAPAAGRGPSHWRQRPAAQRPVLSESEHALPGRPGRRSRSRSRLPPSLVP